MPAKAPPIGLKLKKSLRQLGGQIRKRRKWLKISAVGTAEAAGVSRMTLNRIERGESSVTMGAYLNVISVLGLKLELVEPSRATSFELPRVIQLGDFPQLKSVAWQLASTAKLSPKQALDIYERNWRHLDFENMGADEWALLQKLLALLGKGRPLV